MSRKKFWFFGKELVSEKRLMRELKRIAEMVDLEKEVFNDFFKVIPFIHLYPEALDFVYKYEVLSDLYVKNLNYKDEEVQNSLIGLIKLKEGYHLKYS